MQNAKCKVSIQSPCSGRFLFPLFVIWMRPGTQSNYPAHIRQATEIPGDLSIFFYFSAGFSFASSCFSPLNMVEYSCDTTSYCAICKPTRFYLGKNARLCFVCLQVSIEVVSQQLESCVFRCAASAAHFLFWRLMQWKKNILSRPFLI